MRDKDIRVGMVVRKMELQVRRAGKGFLGCVAGEVPRNARRADTFHCVAFLYSRYMIAGAVFCATPASTRFNIGSA